MGAAGRRDLQGCDGVRQPNLGYLVKMGSRPRASGPAAPVPAAPGALPREPRVRPSVFISPRGGGSTGSGALGSSHPSYQARIGRPPVPTRWTMPLPLLLLVGSLLSLSATAQSPAVKAGPDMPVYPGLGYPQGQAGAYGGNLAPRGVEPRFDYALPNLDSGWSPRVAPPPGYTPNPGPGDPGYRDLPGAGFAVPSLPGGGAPLQGGRAGPWAGQGVEGFRFRGDKGVPEGLWHESPYAPGYRFRPLTPVELERSSSGDGWRPLGRDDRRVGEGDEPGLRGTDAFGYPSDSWFRKYYGERP